MTICIICKIIQPDLRSPNAIGWARVVQHTHTYKGIENNKHVFISERDECHFVLAVMQTNGFRMKA